VTSTISSTRTTSLELLTATLLVLAGYAGCSSDGDTNTNTNTNTNTADGGAASSSSGASGNVDADGGSLVPVPDAGDAAVPVPDDEPPYTPTATFFVSTTGDDDVGDGSSAKPWKSLAKAAATVTQVGALIKVLAGTYTETQTAKLAVGVSIEGEGETTVIKSTLTADWTPMIDAESPEGTAGDQHISSLKLDGQNLSTFWAVRVTGRSNVSMHHTTVIDFKDRGIMFNGRTDNQPKPPKIFSTKNRFHHNTVHNCAAYDTANGVYGRGGLNIGGQDGMTIHDNLITQTERPNGYNGWPIKYDLDGYIKGVKIYNNTLIKNVYMGDYGGDNDWDFAIEIWNGLGGNEIFGNNIQGAIDLVQTKRTTYPQGFWIHDNVLSQPALNAHFQSGIILEQDADGILVENNTFDKLGGGVVAFIEHFVPLNTLKDIVIRKNLFSNMGRATGDGNNGYGILFQGEDNAPFTIENVSVFNNTIVAAPGNAPYVGISLNPGGTPGGTLTNLNVTNNIVVGFKDSWMDIDNAGWITGFNVQNNDAFNNNNANAAKISGSAKSYVASGNLTSDPLFVSGTDFTLKAGSPCINGGLNVGLSFLGTAPDIGWAEQ
jgi:hypothetical protein